MTTMIKIKNEGPGKILVFHGSEQSGSYFIVPAHEARLLSLWKNIALYMSEVEDK